MSKQDQDTSSSTSSGLTRRAALMAPLAMAALARTPAQAQESADAYPSQDVRFICAFPAGSGADVYVRYFADKMRPLMKRTVIVENRAGANGFIATTHVARSKPDGYTVFVHAPSSLAANMHLFKNPPVDVAKELQVVAAINKQPFMLTVGVERPWKTMDELVTAMRAKGDKASYATTAPTGQVAGAWFKQALKLSALEVPYRTGGDTVNDMSTGAIDYAMHDPVHAVAQANAGRLRILAVTTRERMKSLPDVPSIAELGVKDFDVPGWWAAMVPIATPRTIVDKLNAMFSEVVRSEETRQFMAKFGADTWTLDPTAAQKQFVDDVKTWGDFIRLAGIEPKG